MIALATHDTFDAWEALCVQGAIFFVLAVILWIAGDLKREERIEAAGWISLIISVASFLGGLWLALGVS